MTDQKDKDINYESWVRRLSVFVILCALVLCAVFVKAWFDGEFRTVESLQRYVERFGIMGPVVLTVIQALQVVVPVLPGFLGCAVGGVLYGWLIAFLCNYIGISLGSIAAYFIARKFGRPIVKAVFSSERYEKWAMRAAGSRSYAAFLFMGILLPLFPDDFLCYFTGLTKMKPSRFIAIIALGKPWCILAYSIAFSLIG